MRKSLLRSALAASVAFAVSGAAYAANSGEDGSTGANPTQAVTGGSITQDLNVSAVVNRYCRNLATTALAFGNFNPDDGVDQTTTFKVRCTMGTTATISLNLGANADGAQRRMKSGTDHINYQLYSDSAGGAIWGETSGTDTVDVTGAGLGTDKTLTVYGRVPAQLDAKPGVYTDVVQVTVAY